MEISNEVTLSFMQIVTSYTKLENEAALSVIWEI